MRDEAFVSAFAKSYAANMAYEDEPVVREFVTRLNAGEDHAVLYKEFESYTSLLDAVLVFEDGIKFAKGDL